MRVWIYSAEISSRHRADSTWLETVYFSSFYSILFRFVIVFIYIFFFLVESFFFFFGFFIFGFWIYRNGRFPVKSSRGLWIILVYRRMGRKYCIRFGGEFGRFSCFWIYGRMVLILPPAFVLIRINNWLKWCILLFTCNLNHKNLKKGID